MYYKCNIYILNLGYILIKGKCQLKFGEKYATHFQIYEKKIMSYKPDDKLLVSLFWLRCGITLTWWRSSYFGFPINLPHVRMNVAFAIGINIDVNIIRGGALLRLLSRYPAIVSGPLTINWPNSPNPKKTAFEEFVIAVVWNCTTKCICNQPGQCWYWGGGRP